MKILVVITLVSLSLANNLLDMEDILDDKFMPGSLLLLEGTDSYTNSSINPETEQQIYDGSILGAINTMGYHRQKMNEYLCRSYLAGQILSDMSISRIRRRLGEPYSSLGRTIPLKESLQPDNSEIKEALLADEGSSNYKNWLKKSMTLEDIYRQIKDRESNDEKEEVDQDLGVEATAEEYEGEVTGFAPPVNRGQDKLKEQKISQSFSSFSNLGASGYGHGGFSDESGYGHSGHSGYSGGGYDYTPQQPVHTTKGEGGKKDLILKNLFEVALTAIAFISFGCFILQVIMCITTATTNITTVATAVPMMMPTDLPVEPFEGYFEPIKLKVRRSTEQHDTRNNVAMNELSRRVLQSIEAAIVAPDDNANCLRRKLCDDNRYSRELQDNRKIWIPVWSFGMSWLSGRIGLRIPAPTTMMDSLKASILGLGNVKCEILYSNCSLHTLREHRRRKRSYNQKT